MEITDILGHIIGLISTYMCWFFYSHADMFEDGNIDRKDYGD